MKSLAKFFLGKKQGQKFFRLLFRLGLKGMNFGGGSDLRQSGEEWVLEHFAESAPLTGQRIVFDVGANRGDYALAASYILKKNSISHKIYCFEPGKKTFDILSANTQAHNDISRFNFALGDRAEEVRLYFDIETSGLASLYQRELVIGERMELSEQVLVDTVDNFCVRENISQIDFLKLDVEGNEFKVLQGAKGMLDGGKIGFIQFEFGGTDIDARVFFKDFYKLLAPKYHLYRVLKNGLDPIPHYKETDEIFITTNYLAILKANA